MPGRPCSASSTGAVIERSTSRGASPAAWVETSTCSGEMSGAASKGRRCMLRARQNRLVESNSNHDHLVTLSLSARFARGLIDLADCSPQQIRQFVTGATQGWRQSSVAVLCGALRSYFRFRALRRECTDTLMAAVPRVAQWRAASLPTALSEAEIERFLSNFIRTTTEGRRNYAIALCLVDLGLRAGEVARLQLEDLNWREGTLQLTRTKGKLI